MRDPGPEAGVPAFAPVQSALSRSSRPTIWPTPRRRTARHYDPGMRARTVLVSIGALVMLGACGSSGSAASGTSAVPATTSSGAISTASASTAADAPPGPAGAVASATDDWLTYHRDAGRTGLDPVGPALGHPHPVWRSPALDGQVYAEPLVAGNRVIVATENDTLYALSRASGRVLWRSHVATPVPGNTLPCGDIDPSGITGTPVIDPAAGIVYAVAFSASGPHHELVGVSLASGRVHIRRSIDASGADPKTHQERGALALDRGRVLVPYGGLDGDCSTYHGQVVSAPTGTSTGRLLFYHVPSENEGGIWAPDGPAVDPAGNVYVATGNSSSTSRFDFGNSVIKLSPQLKRVGFFAQSQWLSLNESDGDLGSVNPMLLGDGRAYEIGKSGDGYLLEMSGLGGIGGQLGVRHVCGGAFGGLAYADSLVLIPCTDAIHAIRVGAGGRQSPAWTGPGFNGGPPIVVGGAVWTIDVSGGRLVALSLRSGHQLYATGIGSPNTFSTPSASDGVVLAAGGNRIVAVDVR